MPVIAHPCTAGVAMSNLSPYQIRTKKLHWLLRKSRPLGLYLKEVSQGPHTSMRHIKCCGYDDDQSLPPYQSRAKWLPWKLALYILYIGQWAKYLNISGIFTIVGVGWLIPTTIPNQSQEADSVAKKQQALYN